MASEAPPQSPQVIYVESRSNGMAVASLVCGLAGLAIACIPMFFIGGWGLGIAGFVLGLVARARAKREPQIGRKTMATWGVILGIGAFALGCVGYGIVVNAVDDVGKSLDETSQSLDAYSACMDKADTLKEMDACSD